MIVIEKATTIADFREAHALIMAMGQWDVEQCQAHGLPSKDVISAYYSLDAAGLLKHCTQPDTGLYLARQSALALGCVGYGVHGDTAEIFKFYVRPTARGKGVGTRLMAAVLDAIGQQKVHRVNLVTIAFMTDAISLYRKYGFRDCHPFKPAPAGLEAATRYMEMTIR